MELRHLRYFVAVAEALSFTKAARRLRLAQPSLSRQVKNLEEDLGLPLFERVSNRVALTDAGRLFLFESKRILAMCESAVESVRGLNQQIVSSLDIAYAANFHFDCLPASLAAFRKLSPQVTLNLFDMSSAEQLEALKAGKIDLGFVGPRPDYSGDALCFECIAYDSIVVALPVRHPLAKKSRIALEELAPHFFITMTEKTHPGARKWLLDICRESGFEAKILQEAEAEASVMKFVAAGLGAALLPIQMTELEHEGVTFLPVDPLLRREAVVAWRSGELSESLRGYLEILKHLAQSKRPKVFRSRPV